ncbi:MAG: COG1470 family protein [Thermoplasmatota archaeon]
MVRRSLAVWLAVALVGSLAPSATSQSLPQTPIAAGDHATVLSIQVPLLGPQASGSTQVPIDGGILDLRVEPILLPGPGGVVDVEAFLVEARLLLPTGLALPLPSMVIQSEEQSIDGPAAQALAELASEIAQLQQDLESLGDDSEAEPDPEPEPAEPQPDPVAEQVAAIQAQIDALVVQAAWIQALADEAAATAASGIEAQAAIAGAMVARVEAGLALVQQGLDGALATAGQEMPEAPSESESPSASASDSPSPAPSASPPDVPDGSSEMALLAERLVAARAQADEAMAQAGAAQDALAAQAYGLVAQADAMVDEQAAIDGARAAADTAAQALADGETNAQRKVTKWRGVVADEAAGPSGKAEGAAAEAMAAVEDSRARLQWAEDWIAAAQAMGSDVTAGSLADAKRSIDSAQATTMAVLDILEREAASQGAPTSGGLSEAAGAQMAAQLAQAEQSLSDAADAADAAQADLAEALTFLGSVPGGLEPLPEPPTPASLSFDDEAMALCVDVLGSQVCLQYRSPVEASPSSLTVLVAVPVGSATLEQIASMTNSLTGLPEPVPTGFPVPLPTGLPGSSSSSSGSEPSSSASESSSGVPEVLPSASSSSSSSSASPSGQPHLKAVADKETLGLRLGEQGIVRVSVRNDGTASDTVSLTAQSDAPIAIDSTQESMVLAAGQEGVFTVRITPTGAGSGNLQLFAAGNVAATAMDSVLVAIEAPASSPQTDIAASLEPTAIQSAVGQRSPVTLHLQNKGSMADLLDVVVSGNGISAEPASLRVPLAAGEIAVRQVWLTPEQEGPKEVQVRITSDRGADLQPLVLMDAVGLLDPSQLPQPSDELDQAPSDTKDSPGIGVALVGASVLVALLSARRRLKS